MKIDALRVSDEVRDAIASRQPVVALESTIFTHGLPRPRNVEVAMRGEEIVRQGGGVPASMCSRLEAWVGSTTVRRRRLTSPRTYTRWRRRPSSW